jgi:MFS family permease
VVSEDKTLPGTDEDDRAWLSPGVVGVGAASLCSDAGHEMVTSLLPGFVTTTLGGGPAALAAIDGVADALTGLSKLAGGPLAADAALRSRLARGGYIGTAVATAAIGLTTGIWQVGVLRALAWISRGLRSPARDMILIDVSQHRGYGRAIGLERAGDNLGAILGPVLASVLVGVLGVRNAILLSFIPGLLAAVAISVAVRQARASLGNAVGRRTLSLNLRALRRAGMVRLMVPVACFELGNLATTLLILRATDLLTGAGWAADRAASVAILLYAGHNAAAALSSLLAGWLADLRSPRLTFALGAACYVAGYLLFAVDGGFAVALGGFVLAGIGIGLAETAETALVVRQLPAELRSNALGVLGLTQSAGDIGATVAAGVLWSVFAPQVAFGYATAWMLAALLAVRFLRPRAAAHAA